MMLTDYIKYPERPQTHGKKKKKDPEPVKDGERSKATTFFNGLAVQAPLLNATVLLQSGEAFASGVILGVDDTKAYILTAKHNLFVLAGQLTPIDKSTKAPKKPSDYTLTDYGRLGIQIGYRPTALLNPPEDPPKTAPAQVTGFNFAEVTGSADSWTYDAMLFECTNPAFYTFVNTNRFIKKANYSLYQRGLDRVKGRYQLLERSRFSHIQLGYGLARDANMAINRDNYTSYEKKIQCKQSHPATVTTAPVTLYEPNTKETDRTKWRQVSHAIELDADNTKSTAPGDSGGPLFAIKDDKFLLVGVTSGANFYSEESKLTSPPTERSINNNVVTYWQQIFNSCAFLDRT